MRNRKNLIVARNKRNNWLYHKSAARPDRRGGGDSEISGFQQKREAGVVAGLKSMLGIKVDVKVIEPMTITRSEGKAVRVVDKRNLYK